MADFTTTTPELKFSVHTGSDFYEVFVNLGGAGTKTVSGQIAYTFFQGSML